MQFVSAVFRRSLGFVGSVFEVPVGRLKDADSVEAPLVPGQQTGLADEVVGERVDPTPHDEQR
jgi:hypothetical protein